MAFLFEIRNPVLTMKRIGWVSLIHITQLFDSVFCNRIISGQPNSSCWHFILGEQKESSLLRVKGKERMGEIVV